MNWLSFLNGFVGGKKLIRAQKKIRKTKTLKKIAQTKMKNF